MMVQREFTQYTFGYKTIPMDKAAPILGQVRGLPAPAALAGRPEHIIIASIRFSGVRAVHEAA